MSPPSSPEALYHAIPQALADENHVVIPSDIELDADGEEAGSGDLALSTVDLPPVLVDARIQWIHFILGCSVLLPWNGMFLSSQLPQYRCSQFLQVIITATPFFVSRLADSPLKHTFSSYLSMTFTASNFIFLGHATAVVKQVSSLHSLKSTCPRFNTLADFTIPSNTINDTLSINPHFVPDTQYLLPRLTRSLLRICPL